MSTTSTENIKSYGIAELWAIAGDDRHAVRDEAMRRHELAAKRFLKAKKEMQALESLIKEVA